MVLNGLLNLEDYSMNNFLVFQSDFGLNDGAVSAMMGVSYQIDSNLKIESLTHEITPYNIFEASYRLVQPCEYWPSGTTFVSVVDPGVGTNRQSVVAKLKNGQYIVTPNNGTLTHLAKKIGVEEIREIEESKHRRKNTSASYTFHGRDVYANTGAKLASNKISFEEVGNKLDLSEIVYLETIPASFENGVVKGSIDILDVRFGSLWTNIPLELFKKLDLEFKDYVEVSIYHNNNMVYNNKIIYGRSFADVMIGAPIVYTNSLYTIAIALNQGSFAKAHNIDVGLHWKVEIKKA